MLNDLVVSNIKQISHLKSNHIIDKNLTSLHTYCLNVDIFDDDKVYLDTYNQMPTFRKKAINKFKFNKDKKLSLGSWALLQFGMKNNGCENFERYLKWKEHGKPTCETNEFDYKKFNISHSESYALCSISDYEIGCDIQKHEDINKNMIEYCMNKNELYAFKDKVYTDWNLDAFYRLWTLKESLIKMLSIGMLLDPKNIEFTQIDSISNNYDFKIKDKMIDCKINNNNNNNISFLELESLHDYSISVCLAD